MIPREALVDRLHAIKEKPMAWLQEAENRALADWLDAVTAQPVPKASVPEALRKPQKAS